jgi:asparagine synthase (glutamine-hydrolysing)
LDDLEIILWHQDDPLVPFNHYIHYGIYRSAHEQGVRVVLDGFDGDTIVSHGYERLAELVKKLRWGTLLKEARAVSRQFPNQALPLSKVLWDYALRPLAPASLSRFWQRIQGKNSPPWDRDSVIAEAFARRIGLEERIRKLESNASLSFPSARMLHLKGLESPLIPYALELADKTAAACSLEPRYPFFDRRLIEFCLALPAEQKLRSGWSRSILRRVMEGILPSEVQWRNNKADLSPNFRRNLLTLGRETVERILTEEEKAVEEFVDMAALNRVCQRSMKSPSNSDSMTLFVAVTLAAWMRQNRVT